LSDVQNISNNQNKPKRDYRKILIFVSVGIITALIIGFLAFFAYELPASPNGYEAFFAAVSAIGTLITGIALSIFAYYQWRISDRQHRLLYNPEVVISGRGTPQTGPAQYETVKYPY
jgi:membrane protein YdbS with pleckstrin-like domain